MANRSGKKIRNKVEAWVASLPNGIATQPEDLTTPPTKMDFASDEQARRALRVVVRMENKRIRSNHV